MWVSTIDHVKHTTCIIVASVKTVKVYLSKLFSRFTDSQMFQMNKNETNHNYM